MKSIDLILDGVLLCLVMSVGHLSTAAVLQCCFCENILQSTSFNGLDYGPQKHLLDLKRDLREIKKLSIFHLSEH